MSPRLFRILLFFFLAVQSAPGALALQAAEPNAQRGICLPGSPCEKFPQKLVERDRELRDRIDSWANQKEFPWKQIKRLTEKGPGILVLFLLAGVLLLFPRTLDEKRRLQANVRKRGAWIRYGFNLAVLVALAGGSDFLCSGLKEFIGRIKPHVTKLRENAPLSFPSNHAFTTAFLFVLLWRTLPDASKRHRKGALTLLGLWVVFIGLSRVLLGQHYPLDVLGGFMGGTVLALVLAPLVRRTFRWSKASFRS